MIVLECYLISVIFVSIPFLGFCSGKIKGNGIVGGYDCVVIASDRKMIVGIFKELTIPKVIYRGVAVEAQRPSGDILIGKVFDYHFRLICCAVISCYIIVYIITVGNVNPFCAIYDILRNFERFAA